MTAEEYLNKIIDESKIKSPKYAMDIDDIRPTEWLELMQDYANHVLEDRWISVEDRLPESRGHVKLLFQTSEQDINTGVFVMDIFYCKGYEYTLDKVTHWQPLPEPKK